MLLLFLPVVGWEHRIIVLVDYFMCMVILVLRITYAGGAPSDRA
jgi:hypothetical protein